MLYSRWIGTSASSVSCDRLSLFFFERSLSATLFWNVHSGAAGRIGRYGLWASLPDGVDPFEINAGAGAEQMSIVGVNAIEVFSLCRDQVQCIQGPQEHGSVQPQEKSAHLFEQHLRRSDQSPQSVRQVMLKLSLQGIEDVPIHRAFAQFAMKRR